MSDQLNFKAFLQYCYDNLDYSSGSYSDSKHEAAIEAILQKHGFVEFVPGAKVKGYKKKRQACPPGHYVSQPGGKNGNPDFLIRFNDGSYQEVEAKSSKGKKPMFNSVQPKIGCIYIVSSKSLGRTMIFHADDLVTLPERQHYLDYIAELRTVDAKYNDNSFDAKYYARPMYEKLKVYYFKEEVRSAFHSKTMGRIKVTVGPETSAAAMVIPLNANITLAAPTFNPELFEVKNA